MFFSLQFFFLLRFPSSNEQLTYCFKGFLFGFILEITNFSSRKVQEMIILAYYKVTNQMKCYLRQF